MKMKELKPQAVEVFATYIDDIFAREIFEFNFDTWSDAESLYDTDSDAYKAVIVRHIPAIRTALAQEKALNADATSIVVGSTGTIRHEDNNATKRTNGTNSRYAEHHTDGHTQSILQYPDGYTSPPEQSYIRSQADDTPDHDTTDESDTIDTTDTTSGTSNSKTDGTNNTQTTDNLAKASALNAYSSALTKLIEQCVFAFVAETVRGEL